jgi:sugar phosphate isomerase/epimerase
VGAAVGATVGAGVDGGAVGARLALGDGEVELAADVAALARSDGDGVPVLVVVTTDVVEHANARTMVAAAAKRLDITCVTL